MVQYASIGEIIPVVLTAMLGIVCLASAVENFLIVKNKIYETIPLFGAALGLLIPGILSDAIGLVILVLVIISQKIRKKKLENMATPQM